MKETISKEKFCKLYGDQKDRLYRYALYRLGSAEDAEDAVSDAVLAAWKSISSLRSEDSFGPWIMTILKNTCAGKIKALINDRDKASRLADSHDGSGLPASISVELKEALNILSEEEQNIVLLSVIGGLSSREIAESSGLTAGSVRSKLSRSLSKMRDYLS